MPFPKRAVLLAAAFNLALIVFAVLHGLQKKGDPGRYFGEGRYTMIASCVQLALVAVFSFAIFRSRRRVSADRSWTAGHGVWLLAAAGFAFLVCDEAFQFHEKFDGIIRRALHLPDSGWVDRIDDALIGIYALIGLGVLWIFRAELRHFRWMLQPLGVGFVAAFLSVACDAISNRPDALLWFFTNPDVARPLVGWFSVGDGGFTLLAEGFFVAAFYSGWAARHTWESAADGRR